MTVSGILGSGTLPTNPWQRAAFAVFILAIGLRMLFFFQSQDNPTLYSLNLDEAYYVGLGKSIASGFLRGQTEPYYMDPLYGYILGAIFYLFGDNLTTVRIIQILMDSFNTILIYAIGSRIWSRQAGIAGSILYAAYKLSFFYTLLILKETMATTGLLLFFLLLLNTLQTHGSLRWLFFGATAAAVTYFRANFGLIIPLTVVFHALLERPKLKLLFRNALLFLVGAMMILSLGDAHNFLVGNRELNSDYQAVRGAISLYTCNDPQNPTGCFNAPSFSRSRPDTLAGDFQSEAERRTGRSLSMREVAGYWTEKTFESLAETPTAIPLIMANKLQWTLTNYEIPMNQSFYLASRYAGLARWPLPNFAFAVALGLPGIMIGIMSNRKTAWLMLPLLTIFFTLFVFCVSSRFRMPAVPFLLIGAGIFIAELLEYVKQGRGGRILVLTVVAGSLFLASYFSSSVNATGFEEMLLAQAYMDQGELEKAEALAKESTKAFPLNASFPLLLGLISLYKGEPNQAIRYNLHAIKLDPYKATVYNHLGVAYLQAGQPDKAIPVLQTAISLASDEEFLFNLARAWADENHVAKVASISSHFCSGVLSDEKIFLLA
jgi:tetratricopeptide (TPR) repeat protein